MRVRQLPAYKDGFANGIGFAFVVGLFFLPSDDAGLLIGTAVILAIVLNVASTVYTYRNYKSADEGE